MLVQLVILTSQQATTANKNTYEIDLKKGRLAIIAGYYSILPSFISFAALLVNVTAKICRASTPCSNK